MLGHDLIRSVVSLMLEKNTFFVPKVNDLIPRVQYSDKIHSQVTKLKLKLIPIKTFKFCE